MSTILRKILNSLSCKASRFFKVLRPRGITSNCELIITREWPSFKGNPKDEVLQRRRKKTIRKLSAYKKELSMLESFMSAKTKIPCRRVLEVACGTGFFSLELANRGFDVFGLEIDPNLCNILKMTSEHFKINSTVVAGDACSLPFPAQSFDLVFSKSFFEHVYDVDKAISEQVRVLRKGGLLVIEDGNLFNLKSFFNLLFLYPLRTHGKNGGIKWLLSKGTVRKDLYGYLPFGRDEDVKTTAWWKKRLAREDDLIGLEITTTAKYTHPWIPGIFRNFAGSCLALAKKR